jgi:hypothetical protein
MPLSPTGEPAAPEQIGLAFRAMLSGALAGLALIAAALWLVRTLQATGRAPAAPVAGDFVAILVLLAWVGGSAIAGLLTWGLTAPIQSAYRRGGFAMVAGFGTLLLTLITAPVDHIWGRWGLLGLAALCGSTGGLVARRLGNR